MLLSPQPRAPQQATPAAGPPAVAADGPQGRLA